MAYRSSSPTIRRIKTWYRSPTSTRLKDAISPNRHKSDEPSATHSGGIHHVRDPWPGSTSSGPLPKTITVQGLRNRNAPRKRKRTHVVERHHLRRRIVYGWLTSIRVRNARRRPRCLADVARRRSGLVREKWAGVLSPARWGESLFWTGADWNTFTFESLRSIVLSHEFEARTYLRFPF